LIKMLEKTDRRDGVPVALDVPSQAVGLSAVAFL